MKGSTHVVIGLSFGVTTQLLIGFPAERFLEIPFYYGGLVLGSLLPDIDHPQSYLGRRLTPLSVPIFKLFGHRGITHSFLSLSILGIILTESGYVNTYLSGGILLGYLSHLIADMFTPTGIPLFYPMKKKFSFVK